MKCNSTYSQSIRQDTKRCKRHTEQQQEDAAWIRFIHLCKASTCVQPSCAVHPLPYESTTDRKHTHIHTHA